MFVEELDEVPRGATVIFSAHGVALPTCGATPRRARPQGVRRHLPLVTKVHVEVSKMRDQGREVAMIGHEGHPEAEGTMGQSNEGMHLVETEADVAGLEVKDPAKLAYVTQTISSRSTTAPASSPR